MLQLGRVEGQEGLEIRHGDTGERTIIQSGAQLNGCKVRGIIKAGPPPAVMHIKVKPAEQVKIEILRHRKSRKQLDQRVGPSLTLSFMLHFIATTPRFLTGPDIVPSGDQCPAGCVQDRRKSSPLTYRREIELCRPRTGL